jgi:hypothetical protein
MISKRPNAVGDYKVILKMLLIPLETEMPMPMRVLSAAERRMLMSDEYHFRTFITTRTHPSGYKYCEVPDYLLNEIHSRIRKSATVPQ